jgi:hypothetical protein
MCLALPEHLAEQLRIDVALEDNLAVIEELWDYLIAAPASIWGDVPPPNTSDLFELMWEVIYPAAEQQVVVAPAPELIQMSEADVEANDVEGWVAFLDSL